MQAVLNQIAATLLNTDISPDAPAQFAAGFLYGVNNIDQRDYIVGCYEQNTRLEDRLQFIVGLYSFGVWPLGDVIMSRTRDLFGESMANCDETNPQFEQFYSVYDDFSAKPLGALATYTRNYWANRDFVNSSMQQFVDQWNIGVYFNSGMFYAYAMNSLVTGWRPGPRDNIVAYLPF